jgi:hypothetical protein
MGLGRFDKLQSLTRTYTKLTQNGECIVGAFLVLGRATGNLDTQDSLQPELGGSHHLPPYSIPCSSLWGSHPNGFFVWDSQVGVPKFPQLGLPQLWGRIILCADLRLWWGLKQRCSLGREISKGMSHVACTQRNQVHSRLLMVESQIVNLTLGHNLCFRCPNGACEPILDIYASIVF